MGSNETAASDHSTPYLLAPEPQLRPDLWPWSTTRGEDGHLHCGGVDLTTLPTPVYATNLTDLRGRAEVWVTAMAEQFWDGYGMSGASVYYAAKAFMCAAVVRAVTAAGCGIDTASEGELATALQAGADPRRVGLHGNNKSVAELELALNAGIGRIVVDSLAEIDFVAEVAARLGVRAPVMVRVTTGIHAGGHEFIATAHEDQKFGLSLTAGLAAEAIAKIAANPHLHLVGLHSHIGSQIFDLAGFRAAARKLLQLRAEAIAAGIDVPEVDLGGGYGVAYTGADPLAPSAQEIAQTLAEIVRQTCSEVGTDIPHISIEPGRSIAAPATVSLYRVGTIKDVPVGDAVPGGVRRYVSVDGGMSDNIRPVLYGAKYCATLANRVPTGPYRSCRIVGKHCESGDILVPEIELPADLRRGDILAVPVTGAYGQVMASNYNMATRPRVVDVSGSTPQVIWRGDTLADLLAKDPGLDGND